MIPSEIRRCTNFSFFFFNDPPPTEISPLSLHDALPISQRPPLPHRRRQPVTESRHVPLPSSFGRFRVRSAPRKLRCSRTRQRPPTVVASARLMPRTRAEIGRAHV